MNELVACFACDNNMLPGAVGPLNATPFRATPGYGSDHDGFGELEIIVCDPCLTAHSARVAQVVTTRTTTTRREQWRP